MMHSRLREVILLQLNVKMILIILMATRTICFSWPDCQTVLTAADARLESVKIYQKNIPSFGKCILQLNKYFRQKNSRILLSYYFVIRRLQASLIWSRVSRICNRPVLKGLTLWLTHQLIWSRVSRPSNAWRRGWHANDETPKIWYSS